MIDLTHSFWKSNFINFLKLLLLFYRVTYLKVTLLQRLMYWVFEVLRVMLIIFIKWDWGQLIFTVIIFLFTWDAQNDHFNYFWKIYWASASETKMNSTVHIFKTKIFRHCAVFNAFSMLACLNISVAVALQKQRTTKQLGMLKKNSLPTPSMWQLSIEEQQPARKRGIYKINTLSCFVLFLR